MLTSAIIVVFTLTYLAIALEHPLGINKSASALIGAGILWSIYALSLGEPERVSHELNESLESTAEIVFFLMGAMTIVEVIDAHNGFGVITSRIRTSRQSVLLWLVAFISFFLSAALDNLTTTIVMISLLRKVLAEQRERSLFAAIVVIAANSGGAWSPIGDVTTTMLWIGGQISSLAIIKGIFLPSLISMLLPLLVTSFSIRGRRVMPITVPDNALRAVTTPFERGLMFCLGLGILLMVPVFKTVTHLPPYLGILLGLGILWLIGDLLHRKKGDAAKRSLTLVYALRQIDLSSLVFFIGILLSVATLEHTHLLTALAQRLEQTVGREDLIVMLIGLLSAVVDNVPLVAASMSMYSLSDYPTDHFFWEFLAYSAGTGGSILIIGSAAGVAAMGLERIEFFWYMKKMSLPAMLGFLSGAGTYLLNRHLFG